MTAHSMTAPDSGQLDVPFRGPAVIPALSLLSEREWETLRACVHNTRQEAADALGITFQTLKNHLTNIYRKLGVENEREAYVAVGWLVVPDEDYPAYRLTGRIGVLRSRIAALAAEADDIEAGLRRVAS